MTTAKKAVATRKPTAPTVGTTPPEMLAALVAQGADTDKLSAMMDLQMRWEADQARKAYHVALGAFKANPPKLTRNRNVAYGSGSGRTEYSHATLDSIADILGKALNEHGLSFNWTTAQGDGGLITVTCHLTHVLGHSESTSLSAGADQSGGKNNIQAVGSTVSYLQRYTLRSITGTAEADMDNDGAGAEPVETITDDQALKLESLITDHDLDKGKIMAYLAQKLGVEEIADIRAVDYRAVVRKVNATIDAKEGNAEVVK